MTELDQFSQEMLPKLEAELKQAMAQAGGEGLDSLRGMLEYHMGWAGEGAGPQVTGKRVRPLLTLLCTAACGGDWEIALPAAVAIELIHNFSLIHDDIEDNSPLRRGRPTVWRKWGTAQAINTGDAMFTLAHLALLRLEETVSPATALQAARILQETCLYLTEGQFMDLAYESRGDLTIEAYWPMVSGKTAALLSACAELGSLCAGRDQEIREKYRQFGRLLGLAFQAQDDLLGIWGDAAQTGKSAESDLVSGKKSLPALYGLARDGKFAQRWRQGPIQSDEVGDLADQLELEGARAFTQDTANNLTEEALQALETARPEGEAGEALRTLALKLLSRQG
jgi:geranylgeranyl diphosphate synthase type I